MAREDQQVNKASESLEAALEGKFDQDFDSLPDHLKEWVQKEFLFDWDAWSAEQRRFLARQSDGKHNPVLQLIEEKAFDLFVERDEWERLPATVPTEVAVKKDRLAIVDKKERLLDEVVAKGREQILTVADIESGCALTDILTVDISITGDVRYSPATAQGEVQKPDTKSRHAKLREAHQKLKKEHPTKSESWCSKQIAKMDCAQDYKEETIRKIIRTSKVGGNLFAQLPNLSC